jgi:hypothetical protein
MVSSEGWVRVDILLVMVLLRSHVQISLMDTFLPFSRHTVLFFIWHQFETRSTVQ